MGADRSSLPDDAESAPQREEVDEGLAIREPYLRSVLAKFEAGHLQAYDYTRRVLAINAASSTAQMKAIVDQLPDGPANDAGGAPPRGLDPVDLARLASSRLSETRSPTTRYVTLAVVFVLFAVLIVIGMWLATRATRDGVGGECGAERRPHRCRAAMVLTGLGPA